MKKKIIIIFLAFTVFLSLTTTALAAPFGFSHKTDSRKVYSFLDVISSSSILLDIVSSQSSYLIEGNDGLNYEVDKVIALTDTGKTFSEAVESLKPYTDSDDTKDISATALLIGSTLEEDNYALIIYGSQVEEVKYITINDDRVNFRIVDGILRVDSSEKIESMKIIIDGKTIDVTIGSSIEEELSQLKAEVSQLKEDDYLRDSWDDLQDALNMKERTDREKILKIEAVNTALDNLLGKIHLIGTFNEFYYEEKEFEGYHGIESLLSSDVYNIYIDEEKLEERLEEIGIDVTEELNIKMKLDGQFLLGRDRKETFTYFKDGRTSFYFLPGVNESINDWTQISPENLGVSDEDDTHSGEIYIINE